MSVQTHQDSQTFVIQAQMSTPELAQEVLAVTIEAFEKQVAEAYRMNEPNIFVLSPPTFNPNPVGTSKMTYMIIGAMLGLVISGGLLLVRELLNNKISDNSFPESIGLMTLGNITTMTDKGLAEMHQANQLKVENSWDVEGISV